MGETIKDVVYGDAGNRPLKLDLYRPAGEPNGAAVIIWHGGGWRRGSKDMIAPHATILASRGFTVFCPEYRLTGEAKWPAHIHDVKRAIRYVRSEAGTLGFDADKIVGQGHSAGAHLCLLAAGSANESRLDPPGEDNSTSAALAAAVAIYPPTIFFRGERTSGGLPASALGCDESDEAAALASPITHVSAELPPVMLLHGDKDTVVPVSASIRYQEAVRNAGARCDMHIWAGFPHGFANHAELRPMLMTMIAGFFERTVVDPTRFKFAPPPAMAAAQ